MYITSELARSLAVQREYLLTLCECGLIEARPNGRGDYIVEEREKERVVREGLPDRRATPGESGFERAGPNREGVQSLSLELQTERATREFGSLRNPTQEAPKPVKGKGE